MKYIDKVWRFLACCYTIPLVAIAYLIGWTTGTIIVTIRRGYNAFIYSEINKL